MGFKPYVSELSLALSSIDELAWKAALKQLKMPGRIYVAGNGGSAAVAEHLCCDVMKGTRHVDYPIIRAISLVSNMPLYTAISNDLDFKHAVAYQIECLAEEGDTVVLISSSGKSQNIVNAAYRAKSKKCIVIGFTGFTGGQLRDIADISLHVESNNYGIIEDAHQAIMHSLSQAISVERNAE